MFHRIIKKFHILLIQKNYGLYRKKQSINN